MELVSDFKTRLKEALEEKGNNYTDFAKELGVSKQTISAWLKGERSPKSPTATQVALKLNVSPAWLSGFDVEKSLKSPREVISEKAVQFAYKFDNLSNEQQEILQKMLDEMQK